MPSRSNTTRWIKLQLHRGHPKIRALVRSLKRHGAQTQATPDVALACAIDWFRYVDQNIRKATEIIAEDVIDRAAGCQGFARAAASKSVGWLSAQSQGYTIGQYTTWFGDAARIREKNRQYKQAQRARDGEMSGLTVSPDKTSQEPDQTSSNGRALGHPAGVRSDRADRANLRLLQALKLVSEVGISPRNLPACKRRLSQIQDPHPFMLRMLDQVKQQGLVGAAKAGYTNPDRFSRAVRRLLGCAIE